eukprot:4411770-Pyramimonas_sp.AAC.1
MGQEVAELLLQGAPGADDDGEAEARENSLLVFRPSKQELTLRSSGPRVVRRSGFTLILPSYLTSWLSQGQTLRKGVAVDGARDGGAIARACRTSSGGCASTSCSPAPRARAERADPAAARARVRGARAASFLRKAFGEFDEGAGGSSAEAA